MQLFVNEVNPRRVLDFGCGKGTLLSALSDIYSSSPVEFVGYDPAVPEYDTLVDSADLVLCIDVLEHIPEEELEGVIYRISRISDRVVFNLHHGLAREILPNNENAHCTVKNIFFYHDLLKKYFNSLTFLPGRFPLISTLVATFPCSPDLFEKYYTIIRPGYLYNAELEILEKGEQVYASRIRALEQRITNMEVAYNQRFLSRLARFIRRVMKV